MSTKTLRKRIALVAVSALGFGLLSVAPSNAAETASSVVTSIGLTADTVTPGVNAASTVTAKVIHGVVPTTEEITIKAIVLTKPAGATTAITAAETITNQTAGTTLTGLAVVAGGTTSVASIQFDYIVDTGTPPANARTSADASLAAAAQGASGASGLTFGTFAFTGSLAGAYTMRVFHDATANGVADAGETFTDIVITVAASSGVIGNQFPKSDDATFGAAGNLNGVKVSSVSIQTVQPSGRTGVFGAFNPRFLLTRNQDAAGTLANAGADNSTKFATMAFTITNPAGTAVAGVGSIGSTTAVALRSVAGSATPLALVSGAATTQSSATHATADNQTGATVYFPMATAGAYTVTLWHDADLDSVIDAGEAIAQSTFQAATDAAPSITITTQGSTTPALGDADAEIGVLAKICLKNGTLAASLGVNESLTVAGSAGTFIDAASRLEATGAVTLPGQLKMDVNTNAATASLTAANFNASGCAYLNMGNGTAGGGVSVITATIVGGAANGASGSGSFTVANTTLYALATTAAQWGNTAITNPSLSGVKATIPAVANGAQAITYAIKTATATTISASLLTGTTVDKVYDALLTDTRGLITGVVGAQYRVTAASPLTAAAPTATSTTVFSVAVPALAASATNAFTLAINGVGADAAAAVKTITVTNEAAAAAATYVNVAQTAATYSLRAAVGSKNKFTALVVDQFENPMPNVVVSGAISGRNATTVVAPMVTSATGEVSYELSDVYTSTFLLTDTLTFTPSTGTAGTVTVNYATYNAVSKITMTTPDSANATATGVAGSIKSDINAGSKAGPSATLAAVSVILTDVNGATLPAGIPVVFTVSGNAGSAVLSTAVTVNTDATGKAASSIYGWLNGNTTVTATAGGVSATGTIYFLQSAAVSGVQAEARTLTATAKDNIVSAKVTDRFGNPIQGIILSASRSGTGSFGGSSSTTGTTDKAGEVQFVLSSGTADVTVTFSSTTFGQTNATKGFLDAGITALTATAAGTATTAETGVGASFDAAGVNSVTVVGVTDTAVVDTASAAADAAAEATDAANAATDAANAAAEAADAATAAAQDAADAVAALSTQVSEMVDALKKQITALTNLVIKIQKKVKA
jgi:hypothetical protein